MHGLQDRRRVQARRYRRLKHTNKQQRKQRKDTTCRQRGQKRTQHIRWPKLPITAGYPTADQPARHCIGCECNEHVPSVPRFAEIGHLGQLFTPSVATPEGRRAEVLASSMSVSRLSITPSMQCNSIECRRSSRLGNRKHCEGNGAPQAPMLHHKTIMFTY